MNDAMIECKIFNIPSRLHSSSFIFPMYSLINMTSVYWYWEYKWKTGSQSSLWPKCTAVT